MGIKILSWSIREEAFDGKKWSAKVHIRGWNHGTNSVVYFDSNASNAYIVSLAAAQSVINWEWPWWRFSANRKLRYLKQKRWEQRQLFLEKSPSTECTDEQMEKM